MMVTLWPHPFKTVVFSPQTVQKYGAMFTPREVVEHQRGSTEIDNI